MKSILYSITLLSFIFFSCSDERGVHSKTGRENYATYSKLKKDRKEVFEVVRIISLETNDSSYISYPYDFCISGGKIFISSRNNVIKVFNDKGKYLYSIGGIGEAPFEYKSINAIFPVGSDFIGVYDLAQGKLIVYSVTGRFIKSMRLKIPEIYGLRRMNYFNEKYYIQKPFTYNQPFHIMELDSNLKLLNTFVPASEKYRSYSYRGKFHGGLTVSNDSILYEMNSFSGNLVNSVNLVTKQYFTINLGEQPFYSAIPEYARNETTKEDLDNAFKTGTDIYNLFLLKNKYLVVIYANTFEKASDFPCLIYNIETKESTITNRIIFEYCDGQYLYALKYGSNAEMNPNLIAYALKQK